MSEDGTLDPADDTEFDEGTAERLRQAVAADRSRGVSLLDVTGWIN